MPFVRPSIDTIYNRIITGIESRLTGGTALLRRAILRVLAKVFAGAMHLLYGFVEFIAKQLFVDQAEDEWLDRHGYVWGIPRKSASFASGQVVFYGENGSVIPEETLLQTSEGVEYQTTAEVTITSLSVIASVVAVEPGASGNFDGSSNLEMVSPITGVTSEAGVVSPGFTGGVDEESNDDYRARILQRIQNPPMGGTAQDYEIWATSDEVSTANGSVANAWCFPLASGPGTVDVVITAEGTSPVAPSGLITDVQAYIDTVKPVTADVSVVTVDDKEVTMQISIPVIETSVTEAIVSNLEDLIAEVAAPGENLLIAHIRDAIMDSGVDNYEIDWIAVDGGGVAVDDILFVDYEYPVLGTVTFNTL